MAFLNEGHLAPLVLMVCEAITGGDPTTEIAETGLGVRELLSPCTSVLRSESFLPLETPTLWSQGSPAGKSVSWKQNHHP